MHQKWLQLLNGEMSWKENSSLPGLWPYQWMKHTVPQSVEFIARLPASLLVILIMILRFTFLDCCQSL